MVYWFVGAAVVSLLFGIQIGRRTAAFAHAKLIAGALLLMRDDSRKEFLRASQEYLTYMGEQLKK